MAIATKTPRSTNGNASINEVSLIIPRANMQILELEIEGITPYCQHNFSHKVGMKILEQQVSVSKSRKKEPRNIQEDFEGAKHYSTDGWIGIPASAFRNAMISACRLVGYQMTKAKLSVFVEADGLDRDSGQPLVRLLAEEPEMNQMAVRLQSGVTSIAIRPLWRVWGAKLRIRFDGDQFRGNDVFNLLDRAGQQVGIGEGRHDSRSNAGLGWGEFRVIPTANLINI